MVTCRQKTPSPDDHADFDGVETARPVIDSGRAKACEPAANASCVDELEAEGHAPDKDVRGRHGGIEEGREDGAIDVVDCLFAYVSSRTVLQWSGQEWDGMGA